MASREAIKRRIEELEEKTQTKKIPKFEFVVDNERYEELEAGGAGDETGNLDVIRVVFGVKGGNESEE